MVIEPHERIFNGKKSKFKEGAVRGNFVKDNQGVNKFPDQLKTFSVLEDIDFTRPYEGTIFRFPLRTKDQANTSAISKYAYTPAKVTNIPKLDSTPFVQTIEESTPNVLISNCVIGHGDASQVEGGGVEGSAVLEACRKNHHLRA